MRKINFIRVLFLIGILFYGCEVEEIHEVKELEVNTPNSTMSVSAEEVSPWNVFFYDNSVTIGEYVVHFKGTSKQMVEEEVVSTTFTYSVGGKGETAQLDSFYLGVPVECAGEPLSWTPSQSAKLEDNRLKWNSSISKDGAQEFSITYSGDVDYGLVEAIVVRGGIEYSEMVVGPCAGAYDLTGHVFIDANENGIQENSESGIEGYTVVLEQDGYSAEAITDADGFYSFRVVDGDYKVGILDNPLEDQYYTAVFSGKKDVNVPEDLSADFGYKALTAKMTEDFEDGDIILTTASAREWGQQFKMAGKKNSSFTQQEVIDLLEEVEGLLLDIPFDFGNNKINAALNILTKPIKTEEDLFLQQLLAAELNYIYGRGAVDSSGNLKDDFNFALIKYAEAKAVGETSGAADALSLTTTALRTISSGDSKVLSAFNDNGSGGL